MKTLVRWNPTRTIFEEMDRFFEEQAEQSSRTWNLPLDVIENEDGYVIKASLPGVNTESLDVVLEDNVLSIKAEVEAEEVAENEQFHIRERRTGSFSRSLRFPVDVNGDEIVATYTNGVLRVTVPKAEAVKPKQINVTINS
ncbi:MAG: Hsp20/alpha crystallin family protein [Anaerolineae bacterium]|nr:Hsp20/alpha crystallin family protein [Anaerolineae bacterium]